MEKIAEGISDFGDALVTLVILRLFCLGLLMVVILCGSCLCRVRKNLMLSGFAEMTI